MIRVPRVRRAGGSSPRERRNDLSAPNVRADRTPVECPAGVDGAAMALFGSGGEPWPPSRRRTRRRGTTAAGTVNRAAGRAVEKACCAGRAPGSPCLLSWLSMHQKRHRFRRVRCTRCRVRATQRLGANTTSRSPPPDRRRDRGRRVGLTCGGPGGHGGVDVGSPPGFGRASGWTPHLRAGRVPRRPPELRARPHVSGREARVGGFRIALTVRSRSSGDRASVS
jgi:hypothetical protein